MSCEEKFPEYYRLAKESISNSKKFSDLVGTEMDIRAGAEDVMKNFVKTNHNEGVDNPRSYIKRAAYLVLVNRLKPIIKERKEARKIAEHCESHEDEAMHLISDFTKNGTLTPEDMAIIKDCIDHLNTEEKALYYEYFPSGSLREVGQIYGVSYVTIKNRVDPIFQKIQDCVHGRSGH